MAKLLSSDSYITQIVIYVSEVTQITNFLITGIDFFQLHYVPVQDPIKIYKKNQIVDPEHRQTPAFWKYSHLRITFVYHVFMKNPSKRITGQSLYTQQQREGRAARVPP